MFGVGATVWRNLRAGHFCGPIYAVNRKHTELDGVAVFTRAADLPQPPGLAVLCTPPDTVAGLIMFPALPDTQAELIDGPCLALDGTGVAARLRIGGTMTGPLTPPGFVPTGARLSFETAEFWARARQA